LRCWPRRAKRRAQARSANTPAALFRGLGWGAIGSGALGGGAASAFSSNGDINAIAIGALTGAGFGAAGDVGVVSGANSFASYAAHASVGCVSAVAGRGNCGAGAASAVFGKYTTNALGGFGGPGVGGVVARGVATVVAGGVGSVIAGGKFENGATTAAFGYLFNELRHQTSEYQRGEPHGSGLGSGTHWYDVENFACSTANGACTTAAVDSLIKQYPAPAACAITSDCFPVKTGDESFALPVGSVTHTVSASLVINQTLPSHLLHDGMVMRSAVEQNGAIYVRSLGFGTGRFPGPNVSNAKALWEAVDSRIRHKLP